MFAVKRAPPFQTGWPSIVTRPAGSSIELGLAGWGGWADFDEVLASISGGKLPTYAVFQDEGRLSGGLGEEREGPPPVIGGVDVDRSLIVVGEKVNSGGVVTRRPTVTGGSILP